MTSLASDAVTLVEVGPRDGLQNERQVIPVSTKIALINRLSQTGLRHIEAGAFVSPKWVPQMANTDDVLTGIERADDVQYPVLTPNLKGFDLAMAAGARSIAVFGAASESFSRKNINASIDESLDRFRDVISAAQDRSIPVRGYVSCVLGCPYEGHVPLSRVAHVAGRLFDMGCSEISLGDTIGVGTAGQTRTMIRAVKDSVPLDRLAGHFHDTYGQSLANIVAALDEGVRVFDTSVSGLGGCPYAPGASGNVATEDVLYMLHGSGLETGIDLDTMIDVSQWISKLLDRQPASRVTLARMAACALSGP